MPTTASQLTLLIAFLIPGFVFTRVLGFAVPQRTRETSQIVLDSIAASCFNYALLSPLVWVLLRPAAIRHPVVSLALWFVVLFVSPMVLAVLLPWLSERERFQRWRLALRWVHPVPKAWDYFFRQAKPCWVIATFKDGRVLGGLYGTQSFASSYPDTEDLYLERVCTFSAEWKMDGIAERSAGAIIRLVDVQSLEFFQLEE